MEFVRRKRNLIIGLVMAILVGVLLANYAFTIDISRHPMTLAQANTLVQSELPLGTSAHQVKTWLDARKIEHSEYEPHRANDAEGITLSVIRDTHRTVLFSSDIQVSFTFDKHKQLISHSVREMLTGP